MKRELQALARELRGRGMDDDELYRALLKYLSVRLRVSHVVRESRTSRKK